jgi:hypothetical protein
MAITPVFRFSTGPTLVVVLVNSNFARHLEIRVRGTYDPANVLARLTLPSVPRCVAMEPDQRHVLVGTDTAVYRLAFRPERRKRQLRMERVWPTRDWQALQLLHDPRTERVFVGDCRGRVHVLDNRSGWPVETVLSFEGATETDGPRRFPSPAVHSMALSADGRRFMAVGGGGVICVWDTSTWARLARWTMPGTSGGYSALHLAQFADARGMFVDFVNPRVTGTWDLAAGTHLLQRREFWRQRLPVTWCLATCLQTGRKAVVSSNDTVTVFDRDWQMVKRWAGDLSTHVAWAEGACPQLLTGTQPPRSVV